VPWWAATDDLVARVLLSWHMSCAGKEESRLEEDCTKQVEAPSAARERSRWSDGMRNPA